MTDERWRQRIQIEPDAIAAHASADRARRMALERFGHVRRARFLFGWPALAIAAAFTLVLWMTKPAAPIHPPQVTPPTKVQFVLSDGTKVQWVFSDQFAL